MSVKPSIITSYEYMYQRLISMGLTRRDIITLIRERTRPKQPRKNIEATIRAIEGLERVLLKAEKEVPT